MNIKRTRDLGLCTSCEACSAVCPMNAISMEFKNGQYLPLINQKKCIDCGMCAFICPGINFSEKNFSLEKISGNSLECYIAWTKNSNIRKISSSGGVITSLIMRMLEEGYYQGAFVLEDDGTSGKISRLKLVSSPDEVLKSAKSKYLPASIYEIIKEIKEGKNKKYILVGTACQFSAIKRVIQKFNLPENNFIFLGLFCDKTLNYNFVKYLEREYKKIGEKLIKLDFRSKDAGGWPGNMILYFDSGRKTEVNSKERKKVKKFFQLERCLYCIDKFNIKADISFGDCYIENEKESKGKSNIIIRTEKGRDIWKRLKNDFEAEEVAMDKIVSSQKLIDKNNNYIMARCFVEKNKSYYQNIENVNNSREDIEKYNQNLKYIKWGRDYSIARIKIDLFFNKYWIIFKKVVESIIKLLFFSFVFLRDIIKSGKSKERCRNKRIKTVLILGANLKNKGAQAMLFTVISGIGYRFSNVKFCVFSDFDFQKSKEERENFKFMVLPWNPQIKVDLMMNKNKSDANQIKINDCLKNADFAVDISGYTLSSQWELVRSVNYLLTIMIMRKYKVPFYIFPQSLGPFNYKIWEKIMLYPLLFVYLKYPVKIFAREKEGEKCVKKFSRNNVIKSLDIVFQNKGYNLKDIYHKQPSCTEIEIKENSIGVVPNMKIFEHSNKNNDLLLLYKKSIELLIKSEKTVYIFRHSKEDLEVCKKIKDIFKNNKEVILIENNLNVVELELIIKKFNFILASRYHSIVHAYKNSIPAVVIGWATKYYELLDYFNQLNYFVDCRQDIEFEVFRREIKKMIACWEKESKTISEKNVSAQTKNPFDYL